MHDEFIRDEAFLESVQGTGRTWFGGAGDQRKKDYLINLQNCLAS
jgi:hypothetical protein